MDIKYNIYYSSSNSGPWTLANSTPIDHTDSVMSFFIDGLNAQTKYYVQIIGGYIDDDDEFVPLQAQSIGPVNIGASAISSLNGSGTLAPTSIEVITSIPRVVGNSTGLSHTFEVT